MKIEYIFLAFRNLKHRGIRSWLTLLGVFIGITAVISLITVSSGLKAAINAQFGVSSTQIITIQAGGLTGYGAPGTGVANPLTQEDAEKIEKLGTIETVLPRNIESIKVEFNDRVIFTSAVSIPEDKYKETYEMQELEIEKGRFLGSGDSGNILLGNSLAYENSNGFDKDIEPGDKVLIKDKRFKVVGIIKKKGSFLLDRVVMITHEDLEKLSGFGGNVDIIGAKVKDKDLMDKAKLEIEDLLRERRDVDKGEEDFSVSTPEATLETVNTILGGVQAFIVIIAGISIVVGAIGIVNTMATSVLERKREIGIMKSVGARNSDIFFQFFTESGLLGLVGGIIGVIIGFGIGTGGTLAINSLIGAEVSPQINIPLIIGSLVGSFLVGSVSGIIPALNAAKQNPVDALRS
jgi:putative ABC transport system permease protein